MDFAQSIEKEMKRKREEGKLKKEIEVGYELRAEESKVKVRSWHLRHRRNLACLHLRVF